MLNLIFGLLHFQLRWWKLYVKEWMPVIQKLCSLLGTSLNFSIFKLSNKHVYKLNFHSSTFNIKIQQGMRTWGIVCIIKLLNWDWFYELQLVGLGHQSRISYVVEVGKTVLKKTRLLLHINARVMSRELVALL